MAHPAASESCPDPVTKLVLRGLPQNFDSDKLESHFEALGNDIQVENVSIRPDGSRTIVLSGATSKGTRFRSKMYNFMHIHVHT